MAKNKKKSLMESMTTGERKSDDTRARIFSVALRLIDSIGAEKLTVRKLAEAAGVSPALVIQYFGSKGHLLREAFTNENATLLAHVKDLVDSVDQSSDTQAVISDVVRYFLKRDLAHPSLTMQVIQHDLAMDYSFEDHFEENIEPVLQLLTRVFKNLEPGLTDTDARTAAGMLSMIYGNALRIIIQREMSEDQALSFLAPYIEMMIEGLKGIAKRY